MKIKFDFLIIVTLITFSLFCELSFSETDINSLPSVLFEKTRTSEDIAKADKKDEFMFAPRTNIRYSNNDGIPYRWQLIDMKRRSDGKVFWQVIRINMKDFETKEYNIPDLDLSTRAKLAENIYWMYLPQPVDLIVSPNGKYFLVKVTFGKTYLFDSETGKEIDLYEKDDTSDYSMRLRRGEVMIGFTSNSSGVYCGLQSLNPAIIVRNIKTGNKELYLSRELNFMPGTPDGYEHWPGGNFNRNTGGILYNNLPPLLESPDGKWTAIPATVFHFKNLMHLVIICNNENKRIAALSIIFMSVQERLTDDDSIFDFSNDSRYLSIVNGRTQMQVYDTKNETISNKCNTKLLPSNVHDVKPTIITARFLNESNIGLIYKVFQTPERSFVWNHDNQKFEKPFWDIQEYIVEDLFVSPDHKYLITSHYNHSKFVVSRNFAKDNNGFVICWDLETEKRLFTLEPKNLFKIYVPPCWSVLEYHCPKTNDSTTTTIYNLESFIKKINDKKGKQISFDKSELPYHDWLSLDGQYSITARLILIDRIDKSAVNKIDLDKLKNTIVTIEKKETKKLVKVFFKNLSQNDQKYILEQIIKQSKQK